MRIEQIEYDKKQFLELLLLGDEQESQIDSYLERGELFALCDPDVRAVCVVTDEGGGTFELKNLAVAPPHQRQGYGRALVDFLCRRYAKKGHTLLAGTGDSPLTVPFYLACGFEESHRVPNFFLDHYDHPIFEAGRQLIDMVYFKKALYESDREQMG